MGRKQALTVVDQFALDVWMAARVLLLVTVEVLNVKLASGI
jgi:hypothetical protein